MPIRGYSKGHSSLQIDYTLVKRPLNRPAGLCVTTVPEMGGEFSAALLENTETSQIKATTDMLMVKVAC